MNHAFRRSRPDSRLRLAPLLFLAIPALVITGCRPGGTNGLTSGDGTATRPLAGQFQDVTASAGIGFRHTNGQPEQFLFLQTLGGGCAILDYDGDGWQDLLFASPGEFPRRQSGRNLALYRNVTGTAGPRAGAGAAALRFQEVTQGSGLDTHCYYAQGVAVGDYDNDGKPDVFVGGYGGCKLFRNESLPDRALFRDVTAAAGVGDQEAGTRWATSAAWADYDHDGRLDLYLCHYAVWSPETDRRCPLPGGEFNLCSPTVYEGEPDRLFRNEGNGTFRDVSHSAGIATHRRRGLALSWIDYDGDGWDDVYVANDLNPNLLLRNGGDGTFTDVAEAVGVAYGAEGQTLSGMGVAAGDFDASGRESLFVTNLNGQLFSLFQNLGGHQFAYATDQAGLRVPTLPNSGFGCSFLDYDLDGWPDLVAGNGHVNPGIDRMIPGVRYEEARGLYRNTGKAAFEDVTSRSGDLQVRRSTRGLAVGDLDNDGRPDLVCVNRNAPAEVFRYGGGAGNRWLSVRLIGTRSNRDGAGAKVWVTAGGRRRLAVARQGSSYGCTHDPRLLFGLGEAARVERLEIVWPSGRQDRHTGLEADRQVVCTEGRGYSVEGKGAMGQ